MNNLLLKSYLRCKRKAWLEFHVDKSVQTWSAQKSIQMITEYENFNKFTNGNLYSGYKACEKGFQGVINLKIKDKIYEDIDIEIHPHLLIKTKGKSIWGEYQFIPATSKLGRKTTKEHLIDIAFCSISIEKLQKAKIDYGLVISSRKNQIYTEKIFITKKLKDKAINLFYELQQSLKENIPNITENRKKCSICSWQEFCNSEAKSKGFLTDIDGIGTKTASLLKNSGIYNIKQLASSNKYKLNKHLSLSKENNIEKINKIIKQSKSYSTGLPIHLNSKQNSSDLYSRIKNGFFIFDIESNPDQNHDFLYGFISIKRIFDNYENSSYQPILNLKNINNEVHQNIFQKFNSRKNWPILHYGDTEKISIIKLAKTANLTSIEIERLKVRFIDLHLIIRNSWILPLKNYGLKTVANWIGFNWSQRNVSGSKALFWWIQYKNTKENSFLEKIIKYNHEDCLATLEITKWLLANSNSNLKEN